MADYGALRIIVTADTKGLGKQIAVEATSAGDKAGKGIGAAIGKGVSGAAGLIGGALKSVTVGAANVLGGATIAATGFGVASIGASLRVDELNLAMAAVAKGTKTSLPDMQKATKGIAGQGVAYADAQKLVIDFTRANLSMVDAQKVATAAQDLAVLSGKSSSETTSILTEAIIKQSPQLLEAAGVTTSLGQAQDAYSKKTGIAVSAMTVADKQQALLNEVLRQGGQVAGSYEASMTNAGKVLRSLPRVFNDLAVTVGSRLTPAVSPLILKFYEISKAFVSAVQPGGALSPVMDAIGSAATKLLEPAGKALDTLLKWIKELKPGQFTAIADAIQKFAQPIAAVAAGLAAFAGGNILGTIPLVGKLLSGLGGPIGIVAAAVLTLVGTSDGLGTSMSGLIDTFKPIIGTAQELGAALMVNLGDIMKILSPIITEIAGTLGSILGDALAVVAQILPDVMGAFVSLIDGVSPLLPFIASIAEMLGQTLGTAIINVMPIVVSLAETIGTVLGAALDVLKPLLPIVGQLFSDILDAAKPLMPIIGEVAKQLGGVLAGVLETLGPIIADVVKILADGLLDVFTKILPSLPPLLEALPVVATAFGNILTSIAPLLPELAKFIVLLVDSAVVPVIISLAEVVTDLATSFPGATAGLLAFGVAFGPMKSGVLGAVGGIEKLGGKIATLAGKSTLDALPALDGIRLKAMGMGESMGKLGGVLKTAGGAVKAFSLTLLASPITWIVVGVVALVAAVVLLYKNCEPVRKVIDGIGQALLGVGKAILGGLLAGFSKLKDIVKIVGTVFADMGKAVATGVTNAITFVKELPGKAVAALSSFGTMIGGAISGAFKAALGFVQTGIGWIGEAFGKITDILAPIGAVFGKIVEIIRIPLDGIVTVVRGIVQVIIGIFTLDFGKITEGVGKIFDGLLQWFLGLPILLIVAISTFGPKVIEWIGGVFTSFSALVATGVANVITFFAGLPGKASAALASLGGLIAGVATAAWTAFATAVTTGIANAIRFVQQLPGKAVSALASLGGLIAGVATRAWTALGVAVSTGVTNAVTFMRTLPGKAVGALSDLGSKIAGTATKAWTTAGAAISTGVGNAVKFVKEFPGKAATALSDLGSKLAGVGKTALTELGKAVSEGITSALRFFSEFPGKIKGAVGSVAGSVSGIGADIMSGIVSGVGDVGSAIWNKIKGGIGSLVDKAKGLLKSGSPSKLFAEEVGRPITDGIVLGIDQGMPDLQNSLNSLTDIPDVTVGADVSSLSAAGRAALAGPLTSTVDPSTAGDAMLAREMRQMIRLLEMGTKVEIDGQPVATAVAAQTLYGVMA